ncbi:DUF736 family protein [Sphingobium sp.]|uniref:DUF736 family protein n=1 Tax=Sphingobium sp. TaxID=1912891 RepID=UPI001A1E1F94|nr:DUF736 family protein [Sphingobium sp.]MBJ7376354.1 DUF736 family protein [Sphingobium sp.]
MSTLGIVSRNPETNEMRGSIGLLGRRNPLGIEIMPNPEKRAEKQPDFRIWSGPNDIGGGWIKKNRETGAPYISLRIFHPQIAPWPIFANLGRAAGQDDEDVLALIVNEAA